MTIENLRRHWALQLREEGVVLAGGFLRDSLLGVTPKDIDFFMFYQAAPRMYEALRQRIAAWEEEPIVTVPGQSVRSVSATGDAYRTWAEGRPYNIVSTNIGRTWSGEVVNFILLNWTRGTITHVIRGFDYSVNTFVWDCQYSTLYHGNKAFTDLFNRKLRRVPGSVVTAERHGVMLRKGFTPV